MLAIKVFLSLSIRSTQRTHHIHTRSGRIEAIYFLLLLIAPHVHALLYVLEILTASHVVRGFAPGHRLLR